MATQVPDTGEPLLRNRDGAVVVPAGVSSSPTSHNRAKRWLIRTCSVKTLKKRLPILEWLPKYNVHKLQSDMIAGITVGLTVIPQGMAYASVATLPLQYGLYSAFMACFVYCVFGSTNEVTIGPTAIMGLLTAEQVRKGGAAYAVILCFLSGVVEFLFGIFNLGFLIDFIAAPVISGFSSAAAIIIAATQIKGLMGLKFKADQFIMVVYNVGLHIENTNWWDLGLGIICMTILLCLRKLNSFRWSNDNLTATKRVLRKFFWLISTGRNALIVILTGLMAFALVQFDCNKFTLTGDVQGGLPSFHLPPFYIIRPEEFTINETTVWKNETVTFLTILSEMGSSLGLVPLLAILEHIAIAKVFAQGRTLDASQEIITLGLSNIMGSFVSSFPATGSFSRTALNAGSGVKSPLGGVFTGGLVLLALGVLTSSFKFIPKATLSAVIISTVIFMIEYEMVHHLWKTKKTDFVILMATFFSCIFIGAEYGIIIGIGIGIVILLYNTARPTITIEKTTLPDVEYIIVQPDRTLYYPAMEYLKYRVNKVNTVFTDVPVVFDGLHLAGPDYTIAQGIKQLTTEFKNRNQRLLFTNLRQEVVDVIETLKPDEFQHCRTKDEIEGLLKEKYPDSLVVNGSIQSLPRKGGKVVEGDPAEGAGEEEASRRQSLAQMAQFLFPAEYEPPAMVSKGVQVGEGARDSPSSSVPKSGSVDST